jgi:hypothetical protein
MHTTSRSPGQRWLLLLHPETVESRHPDPCPVQDIVPDIVPTLIARRGIGIHCAAPLLLTADGNPGWLPQRRHVRALCAATRSEPAAGSDSVTASTVAVTEPPLSGLLS